MKKLLFLLITSFSISMAAVAQDVEVITEQTIRDDIRTVQALYGPYGEAAEAARKQVAATLKGATVNTIGCFPYTTTSYYQVKKGAKAYIIEYNLKTKAQHTLIIDEENAPVSVVGRLSADCREVFVVSSQGKDHLSKIYMYNPQSHLSRLIVKCKSVVQKEYYAEIVPLPNSEYPDKNLFTYDGYRIYQLTNDPRNPYIINVDKKEYLDDPFDEDLIDPNGGFSDD